MTTGDFSPSATIATEAAGTSGFWRELGAELLADRTIYLLGAAYCLGAIALAAWLPGEQHPNFLTYGGLWLRLGVPVLLLFLVLTSLPAVIRERPDRPLRLLAVRIGGYLTPRAMAGLGLIALQVVLMGTFTSVKTMLPTISGYVWDAPLADLDAVLHGGVDPWLLIAALVSRPWALHAVEFVYASGWMVMIGLVPAIVALSPRLAAIRVRFFVTYILCWILLGNLLAVATMSAGPAYFGEVTGDFERFRPLLDQVAANAGRLWSAFDIQRMLWHAHESGAASLGSGISAFPSLHVAMATLWAIVAFQRSVRLGIAALAFLAFVLVGSVALGWHYAVDGYVSIPLTILIWKIVGWLPSNTAPPSSRAA
jgi:hypothetical protein